MKGSVDIPGMPTYRVFAGNCIFGFSTVRTIWLCKNLAKNVEIKPCWSFNNQVCSWFFCTSVLIFHYKPCNLTYTVSWCLTDCSVLKNRKNKAGNRTYLVFADCLLERFNSVTEHTLYILDFWQLCRYLFIQDQFCLGCVVFDIRFRAWAHNRPPLPMGLWWGGKWPLCFLDSLDI